MGFCFKLKSKAAQVGLEYLLTYGWALVLIATVVGVFVLVVDPFSGAVSFSSSDPTKMPVKGGSISGGVAGVILQNLSGGSIDVIKAELDGAVFGYSPVKLNGIDVTTINASNPVKVIAGGLLQFEGISYNGPGKGAISINYRDIHGFLRSVAVTGELKGASPPPAGCTIACDDDSGCNDSDSCTVDTCYIHGTCDASCSHSEITACFNGDGCCPGACSSLNDSDCAAECGNNLMEGLEVCDGSDVGDQNCFTREFVDGILACQPGCLAFDTSGCLSSICGNNAKEGSEICDLNNLGGETCVTLGFSGGTLSCQPNCLGFDTNSCFSSVCGNGTREGSELCDGVDLNGQNCVSLGYADGTLACTTQCGFDANSCTSVIPGLAAYWKFNEGTGTTAADSSGNGKSGTLINGPSWVLSGCPDAGCLQLNGTNQYVQVDSPALPTTDFTYSAWVKLTANSDEMLFMAASSAGANELCVHITSTKLRLYLHNVATATTSAAVPIGAWTHIGATRTGGSVNIYINGAPALSATSASALTFSTCPLMLGTDVDSGCAGSLGNWLAGYIDEAKVYGVGLSAAEVCNDCKLYAANVGVACSC